MTGHGTKTPLEDMGVSPEQAEAFVGSVIFVLLEYLIAGLRYLKGEGHKDETIDPLMERVLKAIGPHAQERMARGGRVLYAWIADTLTDVYRGYQEGSIVDQEELRNVIKRVFDAFKCELTPGQVSMFAPTREGISERGGPAQFAKYALGRLQQVHWKTVHNWVVKVDEIAASPKRPPYGIEVTPKEIREYVGHLVDQVEGFEAVFEKTFTEVTTTVDASLNKPIQVAQRQQHVSDAPCDEREAPRPVRSARRKAPGPGRPRRRSK